VVVPIFTANGINPSRGSGPNGRFGRSFILLGASPNSQLSASATFAPNAFYSMSMLDSTGMPIS
jgi:hypothetical protein